MHILPQQRRLRWLGNVRRMSDGRIPKDLLYGQLSAGSRAQGRPKLRFPDVCKRDLKSLDIDVKTWKDLAADRRKWRHELHTGLARSEGKQRQTAEEKRARRKNRQPPSSSNSPFTYTTCGRVCHPSSVCTPTADDALTRAQVHDLPRSTDADDDVCKGDRLVIPAALRKSLTAKLHQTHMGVQSALRPARTSVWYPGMKVQLKQFIASCEVCNTFQTKNQKKTLLSHEIPNRPWSKVAFDIFE